MEQYKQEFIEFMVDCKALKFMIRMVMISMYCSDRHIRVFPSVW